MKTELKAAINDYYKEVGKCIDCFPQILQMKVHIFNETLANKLGYSVDAVQGFTTKKMTSTISYNELFTALTKVMKSAADKNNESNPERAKELFFKYIKSSFPVFLSIAMAYSKIELYKTYYELLKIDKYDPDVLMMEMTLGKFMQGLWPKNSKGLSGEEADYLRECLKYISPTRIVPEKIKAKSKFLKAEYGEECDGEKSNKELLDEKTVEIFNVFLTALLQNLGVNHSETSNFLKKLLTGDEIEKEERQPTS